MGMKPSMHDIHRHRLTPGPFFSNTSPIMASAKANEDAIALRLTKAEENIKRLEKTVAVLEEKLLNTAVGTDGSNYNVLPWLTVNMLGDYVKHKEKTYTTRDGKGKIGKAVNMKRLNPDLREIIDLSESFLCVCIPCLQQGVNSIEYPLLVVCRCLLQVLKVELAMMMSLR